MVEISSFQLTDSPSYSADIWHDIGLKISLNCFNTYWVKVWKSFVGRSKKCPLARFFQFIHKTNTVQVRFQSGELNIGFNHFFQGFGGRHDNLINNMGHTVVTVVISWDNLLKNMNIHFWCMIFFLIISKNILTPELYNRCCWLQVFSFFFNWPFRTMQSPYL